MRVPRVLLFGFGLAGPGCFEDAPTPAACRPGSSGCPCYGNGTCDGDLRCVAEAQLCVPNDCDPGRDGCICDQGACFAPFECVSGVCQTPAASSGDVSTTAEGTSSPGSDSTGGSSLGSDPTVASLASSEVASSESEESETSTTGMPAESTTETSTTETPVVCDELDCAACIVCVGEPGQSCAAERAACPPDTGCDAAVFCFDDCILEGFCFGDCCMDLPNEQAMAAVAFDVCRRNACVEACGLVQAPFCIDP